MLLRRAQQWARMAPEGSLLGLLRGCRQVSTTGGCFAQKRGGGEESKDGEGDAEGKPTRGKREIISDEEAETEPCIVCQRAIAQTPFIYNFSGVEPDHTACRLSEAVKERIWRSYTDNPEPVTIDRLAKEYRIRRQRVHAIVWLKDIEKQEEAAQGSPLEKDIEEHFERVDGTYEAADGERHVKIRRTSPLIKNSAAEDGEGPNWDELSANEDEMMLYEFERRMSFNKKQIAGLIKTDIISRRRPPGGWSYLVEELGEQGKRGKRGGKRFVAEPDGTRRGLNELEKEFLKRESLIPRRKMTAK